MSAASPESQKIDPQQEPPQDEKTILQDPVQQSSPQSVSDAPQDASPSSTGQDQAEIPEDGPGLLARLGAIWVQLRQDLAGLWGAPARPNDTIIALSVMVVGIAVAGVAVSVFATSVQRLDGPALIGPDGQLRPVTALRWETDSVLELGTVGAGVVTWDATSGTLSPDPDPDRSKHTVLSLPPIPSGTEFELRPAVTLVTATADVDNWVSNQLATLDRFEVLGFKGRGGNAPMFNLFAPGRIAIGSSAALHGPSFLSWFSMSDGTSLATRNDLGPAQVSSLVASADRTTAFFGDDTGRVGAVPLDNPQADKGPPLNLDLYNFALTNDTGTGQPEARSVVALATSGSGEDQRVAAAAADGRIVLLRAVNGTAQSPETLPLRNVTAEDVGLAPLELWVEPVVGTPVSPAPDLSVPLGFSSDRTTLMFHDVAKDWLVQVEVGGSAMAVLPLNPQGIVADQLFSMAPKDMGQVLAELPLTATQASLGLQNAPLNLQQVPATNSGAVQDASGRNALREALPWQQPLDLLDHRALSRWEGAVRFVGAAIDPDTRETAAWGPAGEIVVFSAEGQLLFQDSGRVGPFADVAFEPLSGALVALRADGTALRWATSASATAMTFAPPPSPDGAPPPDAVAIAFPPGEAVTEVLWSRTATRAAVLRRYDRATAAPLGNGLEVGFEDTLLPDRSAYLISQINGQELQVRDARTGGTVLHVVFEGGSLVLAPSPDGHDLGVVSRGDATWTLRLAPPGGGSPPTFPEELAVTRLDTQTGAEAAVPLPGGVASDGLSLSADGTTLLVRGRDGQMFAARPTAILRRNPDLTCCITLHPILPGVVAVKALISADGSEAYVAGADHMIWLVDLDLAALAIPLVQTAGPVRGMALSPDEALLAVAEAGGVPKVINLKRARWLTFLPVIGQTPFARPAPLGLRYDPGGKVPAGEDADTIVLATLPVLANAEALQKAAAAQSLQASILQSGALYIVAVPLDKPTDHLGARKTLAKARALAPAARGASLNTMAALCPLPRVLAEGSPVTTLCETQASRGPALQ